MAAGGLAPAEPTQRRPGERDDVIHAVIGTKAQLVKMAPLMRALQERSIPYNFILTGQHRETMDDLRENFSLKAPDVVLHAGRDVVSLPAMALWMARALAASVARRRAIFGGDRRGIVLVHGDTFSTLLGALMGRLAGLTVGHVEAGLRSFHLFHPFPEELTRLLTFRLAQVYYCPGRWALENLRGYRGEKVDTGYNTLLDALRHIRTRFAEARVEVPAEPFCVVTTHRFENLYRKEVLERNLALIERLAARMRCLFILHPITRSRLERWGLRARLERHPRIELRPRYDFLDFIRLISAAEFVVSDGGSNQEECFYLGKPCLLLRRTSERREGLGENALLSEYRPEVFERFARDYPRYRRAPIETAHSPVERICEHLLAYA